MPEVSQLESGPGRVPTQPGLTHPKTPNPASHHAATPRRAGVLGHLINTECLPVAGAFLSVRDSCARNKRAHSPCPHGAHVLAAARQSPPKQVCAMGVRAEEEDEAGRGGCMGARGHFPLSDQG